MRPKSLVLLVLALGCGLVASIGINQVMANRSVGSSANAGETTPIFVALGEIGIGDPLTAEMLKLEEWPKAKVPAGSLSKLEDVEGRRCKQRFYPGEPILEAKLLAPGEKGQSATDLIPKGYRVVPIRVDAVSSSSGMILPGDRVDVMVHISENQGRGIPYARTQTFLQNIKVFAVDDLFSRNDEATVSAKTISLLVTPNQAELVMLAAQLGSVQLVMRSAKDDSDDPTDGADVQELLTGIQSNLPKGAAPDTKEGLLSLLKPAEPAPPKPAPAVAPAPELTPVAPPAPPKTFTMLLIRGPNAETLEFPDDKHPPEHVGGNSAPMTSLGQPELPSTEDNAPTEEGTTDDMSPEDAPPAAASQTDF
jgi:pilus assembly protein CpaB